MLGKDALTDGDGRGERDVSEVHRSGSCIGPNGAGQRVHAEADVYGFGSGSGVAVSLYRCLASRSLDRHSGGTQQLYCGRPENQTPIESLSLPSSLPAIRRPRSPGVTSLRIQLFPSTREGTYIHTQRGS